MPKKAPSFTRPSQIRGCWIDCERCGTTLWSRPSDSRRFCSKGCADEARRKYAVEQRACAECGAGFTYTRRPHSNSAGRYCSTACRDNAYADPTVLRSRWRTTRRAFMAAGNNFCTRCGRNPKLIYVHHIIPVLAGGGSQTWNLISLCSKCHPVLERVSRRIAALPVDIQERAALLVQGFHADAWGEGAAAHG
jgi:5-methylcytosine-specific restriction endonuclease McrA